MARWMSVCITVCITGLGGCNPPAATPPATPPVVAKNPLVGKMIDLTHAYGSDTLYWPTDEKGFQLELGNNGRTPKGYYYAANRFSTAEHGGTHLDAPIHFAEAKPTSADVPLEKLVGEGAVVDVASACAQDPDYQVSIADLRAWEERNKRQLVDVIVLLRTGGASAGPIGSVTWARRIAGSRRSASCGSPVSRPTRHGGSSSSGRSKRSASTRRASTMGAPGSSKRT
jgi:hypothetical protein